LGAPALIVQRKLPRLGSVKWAFVTRILAAPSSIEAFAGRILKTGSLNRYLREYRSETEILFRFSRLATLNIWVIMAIPGEL
jgi:hypothetical protein